MPRSEWSGQVGFPPRYTLHVQRAYPPPPTSPLLPAANHLDEKARQEQERTPHARRAEPCAYQGSAYQGSAEREALEEMQEAPRKRNADDETYHDKLCILMAILLSAIGSYLISTPRESV